jgi:hypothetical protein
MKILKGKLDITQFLSGQDNAISLFKVFIPEEAIEASGQVSSIRIHEHIRIKS